MAKTNRTKAAGRANNYQVWDMAAYYQVRANFEWEKNLVLNYTNFLLFSSFLFQWKMKIVTSQQKANSPLLNSPQTEIAPSAQALSFYTNSLIP